MANNDNLKPFKKGYDPRRNIRGVPADAIKAREAIRKLGAELVHIKEPVWDEETESYKQVEYDITRWQAMIRLMFSSKAPKDREMLLKAGLPGLLKDEVEVNQTGVTKIEIEYVNSQNTTAATTPGANPDQEPAQEV